MRMDPHQVRTRRIVLLTGAIAIPLCLAFLWRSMDEDKEVPVPESGFSAEETALRWKQLDRLQASFWKQSEAQEASVDKAIREGVLAARTAWRQASRDPARKASLPKLVFRMRWDRMSLRGRRRQVRAQRPAGAMTWIAWQLAVETKWDRFTSAHVQINGEDPCEGWSVVSVAYADGPEGTPLRPAPARPDVDYGKEALWPNLIWLSRDFLASCARRTTVLTVSDGSGHEYQIWLDRAECYWIHRHIDVEIPPRKIHLMDWPTTLVPGVPIWSDFDAQRWGSSEDPASEARSGIVPPKDTR